MTGPPDRISTRHYSRTGIINARCFGESFFFKTTSADAEGDYLRATPARIHAEELFEALKALVASDEPWLIGRAQALIASIEGKKP